MPNLTYVKVIFDKILLRSWQDHIKPRSCLDLTLSHSARFSKPLARYDKVRFGKIWQVLARYDEVRLARHNLVRYRQDLAKLGKIRQDMTIVRFGKIWKDLTRYDLGKILARYDKVISWQDTTR